MLIPFCLALLLPLIPASLSLVQDTRPLSKRESAGFQLPLRRVQRLRMDSRYRTGQSMDSDSDLDLINAHEYIYLVTVNIGSQPFDVVLDTGSADLWVASSECDDSDCSKIPTYNANESSTAAMSDMEFKLSYLVGGVTGIIAEEKVDLGPYSITPQTVGLASSIRQMDLASSNNSGILGLSFSAQSVLNKGASATPTILNNLFDYLDDSRRFFAVRLGRFDNNSEASLLSIGELDDDISEMTMFDVLLVGSSEYDYWKLSLRYLTINGSSFTLYPSRIRDAVDPIAILDTGTTLVLGPTKDVDALYTALGPSAQKNKGEMWEVRCEKAVILGFVFGTEGNEKEFVVDPGDFSWEENEDGWCIGGIQANDGVNSGDWLLGDIFLRNVYAIHYGQNSTHPPMIGLSPTIDMDEALRVFRAERGEDDSAVSVLRKRDPEMGKKRVSKGLVCSVSSIGGFVGGVGVTVLFLYMKSRSARYKSTRFLSGSEKKTRRQ